MGAKPVLATDLDPVAVRVAAQNARINGFGDVIETRCGDLLEVVQETADVVIANIISDVIIMLAGPVRQRIVDGGLFICSGISAERREDVLRALDEACYEVLEAPIRGEWCAVAARRR
jgi:ribosomal protein L11 methyltransferase